ncbi:MAG: hypothetical protein AVDCRST_MAG29-1046 [uncultured Nocardioidaceae bacterium]|uniref:LytR/CpsA/Psr regulator C-terminal domain-containing protein n=1 Tax=uncultured Nocardioidaceae bacterium TaxID=253824 RepID=A0A6J4LG38_9ACTN|nr:MAG: hypothetical protein AVDCRST_MAG29-1046 [uncultured Nocardioidaceae bacterium]
MSASATRERPQAEQPAADPQVRRAGADPRLPTWAVLASMALAVIAACAFVLTGSPDPQGRPGAPTTGSAASLPGDAPSVPEGYPRRESFDDGRDRGAGREPTRTAVVDVYNNSGAAGLATATGSEVRGLGWTVGIEDDWYGEIPQSTVYYPAALADEAKQLAKDLGVTRVRPAVSPMSFERLTLIITDPL